MTTFADVDGSAMCGVLQWPGYRDRELVHVVMVFVEVRHDDGLAGLSVRGD